MDIHLELIYFVYIYNIILFVVTLEMKITEINNKKKKVSSESVSHLKYK